VVTASKVAVTTPGSCGWTAYTRCGLNGPVRDGPSHAEQLAEIHRWAAQTSGRALVAVYRDDIDGRSHPHTRSGWQLLSGDIAAGRLPGCEGVVVVSADRVASDMVAAMCAAVAVAVPVAVVNGPTLTATATATGTASSTVGLVSPHDVLRQVVSRCHTYWVSDPHVRWAAPKRSEREPVEPVDVEVLIRRWRREDVMPGYWCSVASMLRECGGSWGDVITYFDAVGFRPSSPKSGGVWRRRELYSLLRRVWPRVPLDDVAVKVLRDPSMVVRDGWRRGAARRTSAGEL